jgi:hypothetical protein
MTKKKLVIFGVFLLCIGSILIRCKNSSIDKAELIKYVKDPQNGLMKEEMVDGFLYQLQFKPSDLILSHEVQGKHEQTKDSLKKQYVNRMYFVLSMSKDSSEILGNMNDRYTELLKEFSFKMNTMIRIIDKNNGQIIYPVDAVYPRTFAVGGPTSILICFDDKLLSRLDRFEVRVKDILNDSSEELKFQFNQTSIKKIPNLKM